MLLRDLITIPEYVSQGDFVLKLTEGVANPEATLRDYVVTKQIEGAFQSALGLIKSAVTGRASKGSYLHGSFGSGKSHFMAVLTLILEQYGPIRERADLAPLIAANEGWMKGRRFLVVPYHMIGATSMEAAILGGYARHVRTHYPAAPAPAVYSSQPIFQNALQLRRQLGDEAFLAELNTTAGALESGWGALEAGWDVARFEAALGAPPGSDEHGALLSVLLQTLLTAYKDVVSGSGFVSLDEGLSAISRHARDLKFDGLVLFLDELVLWLASHMANEDFVMTEGQKVAKLVESQVADRPVPIVSFVARQRDLRELIGEHVPGAEGLGFADVLRWWEGRFTTITLEDRNLPEIAERRVLAPKNPEAKQLIDQAFQETAKVRDEVWRTLLTSNADREMFRKTYPFSPAFMTALVGISSALQRERTALKVMVQLLVDGRDELELGDLVPIGDLFDVIAGGDEPLTDQMRAQFEAARRLYGAKLRPMLLATHNLDDDAARDLPSAHPFRTDDRLVKTLLVAALVPEVEPLKALTASRLAALNHGTMTSPIPGEERTMVLQRAREWASAVAEVKVSDDRQDPTVSIQLVGVDVESIVSQARSADTDGERRRRVRGMVLSALGITSGDTMLLDYSCTWRGTTRSVDLAFGNVRSPMELPDAALSASPGRWKLIVDFPFDEASHSPADDRARLEAYRASHGSTSTVCWLPAHFSHQLERDLGRLVVLEHVLSGERFLTYAAHLGPADQAVAKSMLEGQRMTLVQRVQQAVEQAYGIAHAREGVINTDHTQDELFVSLEQGFAPRPPVAASMREGVDALIGQMLEHQFPAHPRFEEPVRPRDLETVYAEASRAARTEGGRIEVPDATARKLLRRIANPLGLGTMHEAHFVLGDDWVQHVERQRSLAAQRGDEAPLTVGRIRDWLDVPRPMGLTPALQDLVVLVVADQTNRSFRDNGGPVRGRIGGLQERFELVDQELPSEAEWSAANERAGAIFGIPPLPLRNAANVRELAAALNSKADELRGPVADVRQRLERHADALGLEPSHERLRTACAADELLASIARASGSDVDAVRALAQAEVPTTEPALGRSISQSRELPATLGQVRWELIAALDRVESSRTSQAEAVKETVRQASRADEFVTPLAEVLREAEAAAVKILQPDVTREHRRKLSVSKALEILADLKTRHGDGPDLSIDISWTEPA